VRKPQVQAEISTLSTLLARSLAAKLAKDTLDANLVARGLPKTSSLSLSVTTPAEGFVFPTTFLVWIIIGGFFFVLLLLFGVVLLLRRLRKQAAHHAFLVAFRSAKPGTHASKRLTPLPLQRSYAAEEVLGRGAFGCVVKMRTLKGNKAVAIKLLVPERGSSFEDQEKRQLAREAAVLELLTTKKC